MHSQPEALDWRYAYDHRASQNQPSGGDSPDAPLPGERWWWPSGFAEWFALGQTLLPALLFLPGSQAYRFPLRMGAYAVSLVAFGLWWFGRGGLRVTKHPSERWLGLVVVLMLTMIAHPKTPSLLVGLGQVGMYFAIFCPVFWAPAYINRRRQLTRVLAVLLVCNGLNSIVGVLQVYDPDRWMPRQLSAVYSGETGEMMLAAATYVGPNGRRIIRPPGLFDTAGAVCGAGTLASLLGLIFFVESGIAWWKRGLGLAMAGAGISAIYLSHVRSALIVTMGMMTVYVVMLLLQNEKKRVTGFVTFAAGLLTVGLSAATVLGGVSVQERFASLLEDDPRKIYYTARGVQVEYALNDLIYTYPLGAGLGRWGMMSHYFGEKTRMDSRDVVFAEVQPNAWILDGGIALLVLYSLALVVNVVGDLRLIRSLADPEDRLVATAIVATNIGTLALVGSFVPFGTTVGLQYWFLEGVLHGAMANRPRIA